MGAIIVEPRVAIDTAPWIRRVLASLVDDAVLGAVTFLAVPTVNAAAPSLAPITWPGSTGGPGWTSSAWVVGTFLVMLLLQAYTGSSPGKLLLGIAVLRAGRPIGIVRTVLRLLCHVLDGILAIGYLRPLWHPERQTFADSIVGTHVVHAPRTGWRRPATWAAAGAALLGVPLNVGSTTLLNGTLTDCEATVLDAASAHLGWVGVTYQPVIVQERRLWLVRERTAPGGGTVTVEWENPEPGSFEVRATVVSGSLVTTADSSTAPDSGTGGASWLRFDAPDPAVSWTVESVVDGTVTARCTGAAPSPLP